MRRFGANLISSADQLAIRLVGTTIRAGLVRRPAASSMVIWAIVWAVLPRAHLVGEEPAEAHGGQVLQPVHAVLLIGAEHGLEGGREHRLRDLRLAAEAFDGGGDAGGVLPAGGEQVLQLQHGDGLALRQHEGRVAGLGGRFDQVAHDGEQPADALGRQLQHAAVIEAGDEVFADDLRRLDPAALVQAGQDGQQGVADAVDLDAQFQREPAGAGVGYLGVIQAHRLGEARAEIGVDLAAPAHRLQSGDALGEETVPLLAGIAVAEDEDAAPLQRARVGDAELDEAVLPQRLGDGGFGVEVAAHEGRAGGPRQRTNWRSSSASAMPPP